jgi:hypothetical protein
MSGCIFPDHGGSAANKNVALISDTSFSYLDALPQERCGTERSLVLAKAEECTIESVDSLFDKGGNRPLDIDRDWRAPSLLVVS